MSPPLSHHSLAAEKPCIIVPIKKPTSSPFFRNWQPQLTSRTYRYRSSTEYPSRATLFKLIFGCPDILYELTTKFWIDRPHCFGSALVICGSGSSILDECGSGYGSSADPDSGKIWSFPKVNKTNFFSHLIFLTLNNFRPSSLPKIWLHGIYLLFL
jgi:hypothetical protein